MRQAIAYGELCIAFSLRAIHWLQEKISEVEVCKALRFRPCLRKDEFEFVARTQNQVCSGLGADTNPIHPVRRQSGSVRLDRHFEAEVMEGNHQVIIELE